MKKILLILACTAVFAAQAQISTGHAALDPLLNAGTREDALKARDIIARQATGIDPVTMMVLAAKLYETGERDEAVFWFYAAKNRYFTFANAVDRAASGQAGSSEEALMTSLNHVLGETINGYAFCDPAKQQQTARRAIDWVEQNPYARIFDADMVALPGDKQENVQKTLARLREGQAKEAARVNDPAQWQEIKRQRIDKGIEQQYCQP